MKLLYRNNKGNKYLYCLYQVSDIPIMFVNKQALRYWGIMKYGFVFLKKKMSILLRESKFNDSKTCVTNTNSLVCVHAMFEHR